MIGLAACCLEEDNLKPEPANDDPGLITIASEISQIYQTRANDSGFADKDEIGVYIVDYNGSDAGTLRNNGNRADNVKSHSTRQPTNGHRRATSTGRTRRHTSMSMATTLTPQSRMSMNMPSVSIR